MCIFDSLPSTFQSGLLSKVVELLVSYHSNALNNENTQSKVQKNYKN